MKKILLLLFISLIFSLSIHAQTIVGNWKLTWLLVESDMVYSITVPINLNIAEIGKISGNSGCHSFTGIYSFKKPKTQFKKPLKIKLTDIILTNLPCEKTLLAEKAFFQSLHDATTIFVKNEELEIKNSKIGNTMNFILEKNN